MRVPSRPAAKWAVDMAAALCSRRGGATSRNVQMALIAVDARLFSFWRRAADHRRDDAMALLRQVGMAAQAERPCSVLAYGDVKRVELAIALASELVNERRIGVLFTEHSMDVVFAHADRIIVLARGRLIAAGEPAAIRDDPQVQAVYFGSGSTFGQRKGVAA